MSHPRHVLRVLVQALALALTTLSAHPSAAATPAARKAPPATATWIKRLHPDYLDTAWSAVVTRDGNLVVGIQSMALADRPNAMHFAKLDPAGKTLWQKRLPAAPAGNGHQSCEVPMRLREAADGGLLVAGTRCNHTFTGYYQSWPYAWFARLDARAEPVWETAPDRGASVPARQGMPQSYGWDLAEWPDGGLLGLGLHTSSLGFSLWSLELGGDGRVVQARSAFNAGFDEYWWGVDSGGGGPAGVRIGFSVLERRGEARVGWLGRGLEFRDTASLSGPGEEAMLNLRAAPDGGYCLLVKRDGSPLLRRHGADDALLWEQGLDNGVATRLLAGRDGGCLVAGGSEAGVASLRLRKYGADGGLLWSQEIAGRLSPKDLLETPAGGVVAVGLETPADFRGSTAFVLHIAAADLGRAGLRPVRR